MNRQTEWFENWFDSPYYHILYKERDCLEAEQFIDNIVLFLKPNKDALFIDVGCGKGRHSIYLNNKGYQVTGIDLSSNSISEAQKHNSTSLNFHVHDMRNEFKKNQFDFVLNLFTSFGYFENEQDNFDAIQAMCVNLKNKGVLVIDFLNTQKVLSHMVASETKSIDGIDFFITRKVENGFIVKTIKFASDNIEYQFQEKVKTLTFDDFQKYFLANKLKIVHLFGNYQLENYNELQSDRLIMIAEKE